MARTDGPPAEPASDGLRIEDFPDLDKVLVPVLAVKKK